MTRPTIHNRQKSAGPALNRLDFAGACAIAVAVTPSVALPSPESWPLEKCAALDPVPRAVETRAASIFIDATSSQDLLRRTEPRRQDEHQHQRGRGQEIARPRRRPPTRFAAPAARIGAAPYPATVLNGTISVRPAPSGLAGPSRCLPAGLPNDLKALFFLRTFGPDCLKGSGAGQPSTAVTLTCRIPQMVLASALYYLMIVLN